MIRLFLFLPLAAALTAYAFWVYLRLELPVRRRRILAGLRAGALLILLALLFDPPLPWGGVGEGDARWVLLDASLSMAAAGASGTRAWDDASTRAAELAAEGWSVVRFGSGVLNAGAAEPTATVTELAPALRRAAEAGATEVRVLSDLRLHDPVAVRAVLAEAGLSATFESFGIGAVNVGLEGLAVSDAPRRGAPLTAELVVFASGGPDSITVEVHEEGRVVASAALARPAPGLTRRVSLELPPPTGEGRIRYTASVAGTDAFPEDDEAVAYASAGHAEGALVLVSLVPDWEPRYLLPVLEEATGLEAVGYLRAGPDRFVPMGRAAERGAPVDSMAVRRAAADAAVLVIHGVAGASDPWTRGLVRVTGRLLAWPSDPAGARALGLPVGPARGGEWYASGDVPASPMAPDLAGADFAGLPPLSELLPVQARGSAALPLLVQLGGTGPGEPALALLAEGGRRLAVPLARDFWRWAARDGAGRDAYRRLWAGVAGWLLAPDPGATVAELRPIEWVVGRGDPVDWRAPPGDVRLRVTRGDAAVLDTLLQGGGSHRTGALEPGSYDFVATTPEGDAAGEGRFDVARTTPEMLPAAREPAPLAAGTVGHVGRGGGVPLRTLPWPYLLVLTLLCVEWIGRRRAGLR